MEIGQTTFNKTLNIFKRFYIFENLNILELIDKPFELRDYMKPNISSDLTWM